MDIRGIAIFLGLTYSVGYAIAWGGLTSGLLSFESGSILHTLLMVVLLNLPALFAFIAGQTGRGPVLTRVFPINRVAVLRVGVLMTLVFAAYNFIGAAFGFTTLDWRLGTLINVLQQSTGTPLSPEAISVLPAFLIVAGTLLTIVFGATLVAACVLGHVYAWHAFLQDRLAPLGRIRATIAGGALWALWFAPLAYAYVRTTGTLESPDYLSRIYFLPIGGILVAIGLTAVVRRAYEVSGGLGLPAVVLGSFIAHGSGAALSIWNYLFQIETHPWTGLFGVTSALVWLLLAIFPGVLVGGPSATPAAKPLPDAHAAKA